MCPTQEASTGAPGETEEDGPSLLQTLLDGLSSAAPLPDGAMPPFAAAAVRQHRGLVSDPDQIEELYPHADLMISMGQQRSEASTILDFTGDNPEVIRQGLGDLSEYLRV